MAADIDTHGLNNASAPYVDRRLIGGSAALLTGGLLACLAGAAVGAVAVVSACRRYVADREEPPRATVRRLAGTGQVGVDCRRRGVARVLLAGSARPRPVTDGRPTCTDGPW